MRVVKTSPFVLTIGAGADTGAELPGAELSPFSSTEILVLVTDQLVLGGVGVIGVFFVVVGLGGHHGQPGPFVVVTVAVTVLVVGFDGGRVGVSRGGVMISVRMTVMLLPR